MRFLMPACLCIYGLLLTVSGIAGWPLQAVLQATGVPALKHPFMDLRGVAAWCEAFREGLDPAISPTWIVIPGSAAQPNFLMNYSPMVLGFSWVGVLPNAVDVWGILLGIMFFIAVWWLAAHCSFKRGLLWAFLVCSPDALLVVERGNLDILIFSLLVVALVFRGRPTVECGVILAGSLLKFFPIVALISPWKSKNRNSENYATVALGLFLIFLTCIAPRLTSIGGSLSGQCHSAFGSAVPADLLIAAGFSTHIAGISLHWIFQAIALALLILTFALGIYLDSRIADFRIHERSLHAFFLGVPIMTLLYVMGNQMDYKWIFLLFMVPAVLDLLGENSLLVSRISMIWLIGMIVYSWWTFFSDEASLRNALLKQFVMLIIMISGSFLSGCLWKERRAA